MRFCKQFLLGLLLLCPLFVSSSDYGQSKWFGVEHGLNNGTVHGLFNGEKGFLWLATDAGVSRYDGFHFRNYPLPSSIASKEVRSIYGAGDGILFLQLAQGGIACFNTSTEQYLPVNFDASFDMRQISGLCVADELLLYIGTTTGLYSGEIKLVEENGALSVLLKLSKSILTGHVSKIVSDGKENLFLCIDNSRMLQYSMGTQQTKEIALSNGYGHLNNSDIVACSVFGDYLLVCSEQGSLFCYDFKQRACRALQDAGGSNRAQLSDLSVSGITSADGQTFYLSTSDGVYCLKFASKVLTEAPFVVERVSKGKRMTDVLWDASRKTFWIGSYGGGIEKITQAGDDKLCRILLKDGIGVTGIQQDAKGTIWLSTGRSGIWKSTSSVLSADIQFEPWQGAGVHHSSCVYKDKQDGLWFGDDKAGIIYVNPVTNETSHLRLMPDGLTDFSGAVKSLCLDKRDRLWVATSKGLVLLDRKTGNCSLPLKDNAIQEVYSVVEDGGENIWVGTSDGVKRVNMLPGKIDLMGDMERKANVEPTSAYVLYIDKDNHLWAGYADKLIRINTQGEEPVCVFNMTDELKNGRINSMVDDRKGNLWLGCNSGISVVRKAENLIYNYSDLDYVQSLACLPNGQVLWSSSLGMLRYTTAKGSHAANKLMLSDICVDGKSVSVGEEVYGQVVLESAPQLQKQLLFGSGSASLSFYFTDLAYRDEQQPIVYRLLPDEAWRMGTLNAGITYEDLPGGSYTLQVKSVYATGEGTLLELPIIVKEDWWMSFRVPLFAVLINVLLVLVYCFFSRQRRAKRLGASRAKPVGTLGEMVAHVSLLPAALGQEDVLERRADNVVMNLFLRRFMQELLTPLSVTKGLLKEVGTHKGLLPDVSSKMLIAYRNSVGVLNACELLLDIYRQEETGKRLRVAAYSPVKMTDSLLYSMSEFLQIYSVELDYKKEEVPDEIWVDKNKVEFLLHNLLSNAFIHIRYVGRVSLSLTQVVEAGVAYCVIEIADDGKCVVKALEDMTAEELWGDESVTTELGLDVMRGIVHLHHGSLHLKNDPETGTTLVLKLPATKDVFVSDDNVSFVEAEELSVDEENRGAFGESHLNTYDESVLLMQDSVRPAKERGDKDTMLIIEDYPDIRLYLKVLFEKEYNILLATNGVEGVQLAQKEIPDLIICDIMMPLKDGYECCKEIKEGLNTCHIPFIMLTAKVEDEDIVKGLETGADDYILKPFTPNILKARVKSLIQGRINLKQTYSKLFMPPAMEAGVAAEEVNAVSVEDPFISTVVKIIEENIQEPDFNVKKLASDLNMSQPTLYRKVKQYTDFTIIELIRGVRLRKAAILLKQKCYAVQEVGEMVGYNDIPTFRKHFVDMFGTTPSTYVSGGKSGKGKE